jgi:DNA-binding transcriptional LysR family regulator
LRPPRHLSYVAAAADELNVTPAAVGQLVRGLEEVLGIDLFHRSRHGGRGCKRRAPNIECKRGLQINDSAAVIQAAIAGTGVALGRTTLVASDLAEGRLVRPFGDDLAYDFAHYIIHRPHADKEAVIAELKE